MKQSGLLESTPNARGTDRHNVSIQHHEGQSSIAFQRMFPVEDDDGLILPTLDTENTGNPKDVFIAAPVALSPVVELAGPHAQPVDESSDADFGLFHPASDEIHY